MLYPGSACCLKRLDTQLEEEGATFDIVDTKTFEQMKGMTFAKRRSLRPALLSAAALRRPKSTTAPKLTKLNARWIKVSSNGKAQVSRRRQAGAPGMLAGRKT
jgi:hypothetical protein